MVILLIFLFFLFFYIFLCFSPTKKLRSTAGLYAGVWVGAGHSLAQMQALLEKLLPQVPHGKTELIRALIQQLGSIGSQQIRNVAVSSLLGSKKKGYLMFLLLYFDFFPTLVH